MRQLIGQVGGRGFSSVGVWSWLRPWLPLFVFALYALVYSLIYSAERHGLGGTAGLVLFYLYGIGAVIAVRALPLLCLFFVSLFVSLLRPGLARRMGMLGAIVAYIVTLWFLFTTSLQ